jgi:hypothetical protein
MVLRVSEPWASAKSYPALPIRREFVSSGLPSNIIGVITVFRFAVHQRPSLGQGSRHVCHRRHTNPTQGRRPGA